MRKLTEFRFFYNTPLTNFSNTIHFDSNEERDGYFLGGAYRDFTFSDGFNFVRDRGVIHAPIPYNSCAGINYCTFKSEMEDTRFYAYVINYEYVNDRVTKFDLLIDGLMTYCQGNVIEKFRNLSVIRKHMDRQEYNLRIDELKNNDDVIKTFTKRYTHNKKLLFNELSCLIETSCSFTSDFGDVDNPLMETSSGITFDKISAPTELYVVQQQYFNEFMEILSPYPWIAQNIRKISLIPSNILENKLVKVSMENSDFDHLYRVMDKQSSVHSKLHNDLLDISMTIDEMYEMYNLDKEEDKHLLRNEYTTTEVYTFNGEEMYIDNGFLSEKYGLFFRAEMVAGYHNEIAIYIDNYMSDEDVEGAYLNNALYIRNFDDVPILIDNYTLALSKSAYQREVAESRLVTNRLSNIASGDDLKSRFYDAASLVTNFSPINFFGKFVSEHEYYENQLAEFKDMKLQTPNITSQSHGNALSVAGDFFGIHVKHSQPTNKEWEKVKKYYKSFGYAVNDENSSVKVKTMTIADYVQFRGDFMIEGADIAIVEMLKAQFENGVRFWHYDGTWDNPMRKDLINNKMR